MTLDYFLFFLTKKETKKSRKKECSAFFPGQRTATPTGRKMFTGSDGVVRDHASCYAATLKALLFRLIVDKRECFIKGEKEALEMF